MGGFGPLFYLTLMSKNMGIQVITAHIVLLTDLMLHGDLVPVDTTLEVEKRLADQWKGAKLARAATDEEIAEYQGGVAEAEGLLDDVDGLAAQKVALEQDIERLGTQHGTLTSEITVLEGQKNTLTGEVKALEARKVEAEKPVTAAKPK